MVVTITGGDAAEFLATTMPEDYIIDGLGGSDTISALMGGSGTIFGGSGDDVRSSRQWPGRDLRQYGAPTKSTWVTPMVRSTAARATTCWSPIPAMY